MTAADVLAQIASRLEDTVSDGNASDELRAIYLIAIGRMCAWCEARPGDNDYCVGDGSAHPWITNQPNGSE